MKYLEQNFESKLHLKQTTHSVCWTCMSGRCMLKFHKISYWIGRCNCHFNTNLKISFTTCCRTYTSKILCVWLALGSFMENSAKSQFYSVLFNKFHHKTNLITLFKRKLRSQDSEILRSKGTSHTNSDSDYENQNLTALFLKFVNLRGSYKFRNFEGLFHSGQYDESTHTRLAHEFFFVKLGM
jgi:hypothetical protein